MTATRPAAAYSCAIAVMAKAPRPGCVKTRLMPVLTGEMAAQLSASFLRDITGNIQLAARAAPISGYVAYAPEGQEALFDGMLAPGTDLVLADGRGVFPPGIEGFGRCLLNAARALSARGHQAVCLLNSDSPTLPTSVLVDAAEALARPGDRVVLGPAEDGGYYLIGMTTPHPSLFERIAWSTDLVARQTRERARAAGIELVELAPWYDVDDAASLARLVHELNTLEPAGPGVRPFRAASTAACLDRMGLAARGESVSA